MTPEQWKQIHYFTRNEFTCKHCGREEMDFSFMAKLDLLRTMQGSPLVISSGWRCPEHNNIVSETGLEGPHTTGKAADILIAGEQAYRLIANAIITFRGIGVKQKGDYQARFIHLDTLEDNRPRIWSY